jgi:outer membrane receptor protein involved in Fe transport
VWGRDSVVILKYWARCIPVFLACATALFAQSGSSTGEIQGTVVDASNGAIAGSSVEVRSLTRGWESYKVKTNDAGVYQVLELQPGLYEVRVSANGFREQVRSPIPVEVGKSQAVDIILTVGPADAVIINVTDSLHLTETQRTEQSTNINQSTLSQIPMDRRDYLNAAFLAPGVADSEALADSNDYRVVQSAQSGISFSGNNGRGNSITVDGAEANDSGGGVRPTLSQEGVEEFQINRSNYSADRGSASGGVINIVSKEGTDAFHFSAFGFFRNDVFDAADPFARDLVNGTLQRIKPPSDRQQFGGTVGGTLIPKKTFFFGAFEGLERNESNSVAVLTDRSIFNPTPEQETVLAGLPPSQAALLRPAFVASPTTQNLFEINSGVFPFNGSDYKASVRLDHQLSSQNRMMFRYNMADIDESNPNARALIGASRSINTGRLDHTGVLSWTRFISATAVNRLHYQFNYGNFRVSTAEKFGPEINITGFGYFNRDAFLPSNILWRRHEFADDLTLVRGKHQLKLGGQTLIRGNHVESHAFLAGRFTFGSLPGTVLGVPALASTTLTAVQAFNLGIPQSYQQGFGDPNVGSTDPFFAVYAQDSWQIRTNLTLDLGLRYEIDDLPAPTRTDKNNFGPRLGFAWDPKGDRKTTVRGGYGIFYAPTNYALGATVDVLGEFNGHRQIAQVLTTIQTPGISSAPNIFNTLRAQGVITVPTPTRSITEADLSQFGITISHDGPRPPFTVLFRSADDFASSYTQQASLGFEHEFGSRWLVSANYLFVRGLKIMRARDENLLPAPVSPTLGIRVWSAPYFKDPALLQGNVYESTGNSFYHGLILEATTRISPRVRVTANYTLSKAIDEVVDWNSDFQANDQTNLRAERALSSFDQRHKFVGYAFLQSPLTPGHGTVSDIFGNFTLSPILRINSARPFNLLAGTDLNQDRHLTTDRPISAGRNTGVGPGYWTADLRLTRLVTVSDRGRLEFIAEAFNLFNRLNFRSLNNIVGNIAPPFRLHGNENLSPSQPLGFTSAFDARRFQFGARISF